MDSDGVIWLSLMVLLILLVIVVIVFFEYDRPALPTSGETIHLLTTTGQVVGTELDYASNTTAQRLVLGGSFPFTGHVINTDNGFRLVSEDQQLTIYNVPNDAALYLGVPPSSANTDYEYVRSRQLYAAGTRNAWSAQNPVDTGSLLQLEGGQGQVTILGFVFRTVVA